MSRIANVFPLTYGVAYARQKKLRPANHKRNLRNLKPPENGGEGGMVNEGKSIVGGLKWEEVEMFIYK